VTCLKCGRSLCEYDESEKAVKAERAERFKAMGRGPAKPKRKAAPPGGPAGNGPSPPNPHANLPAVDPFPLDVFPAKLQTYITEAAEAHSCPPDFIAVPMLVVAGAAIGNARVLELRRTFQASSSIYACLIGNPGLTKTPAQNFVIKPVHKRSDELSEEHARAMARHLSAKEEKKQRKRRRDGDDDEQVAVSEEVLKQPVEQRIDTSDATVESVADLLSKNYRGLLLHRDELAGWALSMNVYRKGKGADRQFFMSVYSNSPTKVDRKTHVGGPLRLPRPHLGILGGATPQMLSVFQEEGGRDDGFLDRIIYIWPDGKSYNPWTNADVRPEVERAWEECVGKLYTLKIGGTRKRPAPVGVGLTEPAMREWEALFNGMAGDIADDCFDKGLIGPWRKFQTYAARLTLILHELRCACGESISEEIVDADAVRAAGRVVNYFQSHAVRVRSAMASRVEVAEVDGAFGTAVAKVVTDAGLYFPRFPHNSP
jgi:hypothetical protein